MLLQLHREQYSAERMTLVVLGGQTLEQLQQWVEDLFSAVPSGRGLQPTYFDAGMPYQVTHHFLDMVRLHPFVHRRLACQNALAIATCVEAQDAQKA